MSNSRTTLCQGSRWYKSLHQWIWLAETSVQPIVSPVAAVAAAVGMRDICGKCCDAEMSSREGANKSYISFLAKGEGNTLKGYATFPSIWVSKPVILLEEN